MTKNAALVVSLILLCAGVGSAAGGKRSPAHPTKLAPSIKHEKSLGPKPTPRWYWRWTVWQLGESYARGHARQSALRPKQAPQRIPRWAWRRLHFFILARHDRTSGTWTKRPPRRPRFAASGTGVTALGGSIAHLAHPSLYSMVIGDAWDNISRLQHVAGRGLAYFNGTVVDRSYSDGVTYTDAVNHRWLLHCGTGYCINPVYNSYGVDLGNASFQRAWISNVLAYLKTHPGIDGIFIDSVLYDPYATFRAYPNKYPNTASWDAATLSFMHAVHSALHAKGYYVAANVGAYKPADNSYDDGTATLNWWKKVAPYTDGMMNEYYDEAASGAHLDQPRSSGTAWYQEWGGWQRLIGATQSKGKDFIGYMHGTSCTDTALMTYGKASFLLEWNGGDSVFAYNGGKCDPTNSAWTTNIGTPAGPKFQVGVGWERPYTAGTVLVNPSPSAHQNFEVKGMTYTLGPTTARIIAG